jgi:hypothetical protein
MRKKKPFIIAITFYVLFLANLLSYSLTYRALKTNHYIWDLWAVSQYLTFFIALISIEKSILTKSLKKKMVFLFHIIYINNYILFRIYPIYFIKKRLENTFNIRFNNVFINRSYCAYRKA